MGILIRLVGVLMVAAVASCGSVTPIAPADSGAADVDAELGPEVGRLDASIELHAGDVLERDAGADVVEVLEHDAGDVAAHVDAPPSSAGNLIANGDFSSGMTNWHVVGAGASSSVVVDGKLCATLAAGLPAYVGWPADPSVGTPLSSLAPLRFSFDVSTTSALSMFNASVGHATTPFTIDYAADDVVPAGAATTMSHPFTMPAGGDTDAGIVFSVQAPAGAVVCFDNVYVGSR